MKRDGPNHLPTYLLRYMLERIRKKYGYYIVLVVVAVVVLVLALAIYSRCRTSDIKCSIVHSKELLQIVLLVLEYNKSY